MKSLICLFSQPGLTMPRPMVPEIHSSENPDQPSPISVLQPPFEDYNNNNASHESLNCMKSGDQGNLFLCVFFSVYNDSTEVRTITSRILHQPPTTRLTLVIQFKFLFDIYINIYYRAYFKSQLLLFHY